jgi:hypothetical protein
MQYCVHVYKAQSLHAQLVLSSIYRERIEREESARDAADVRLLREIRARVRVGFGIQNGKTSDTMCFWRQSPSLLGLQKEPQLLASLRVVADRHK